MKAFVRGILLAAAVLFLGGTALRAQNFTLEGSVFFRDSTITPAAYITVYCPSLGTGTLTDEQGCFSLRLPVQGTHKIEFSRMGYRTVEYEAVYGGAGNQQMQPVYMELQPIFLASAYVTPDGKSSADYILSQVWKTAKVNKKRLGDYGAYVNYNLSTHQMPLVSQLASGFTRNMARPAVYLTGYGPLINFIFNNDDVAVKASLKRTVIGGKTKDTEQRLISSNKVLPDGVRKNVLSLFSLVDLYGMLYGEGNEWGKKFADKHKFRLTGTYEYAGHLVDVLYWKHQYSGVSVTVHIVEDAWGILRIEVGRGKEVVRCEARDIGGEIYMPVTLVFKPSLSLIKKENLPKVVDDLEQSKDISKGTARRARKLIEENKDNLNPSVTIGYSVKYFKP